MAFQVVVYFTPRLSRSAWRTQYHSSVQDQSGAAVADTESSTWDAPVTFRPWPIQVTFSGTLPEASAGVEFSDIETPPAWTYRPFPRPWAPRQVWTTPPGDDSVIQAPDSGGHAPAVFRNPYNPAAQLRYLLGRPALNDSAPTPGPDFERGAIPQNLFTNPYVAWGYIGTPSTDDTWDLEHFTRYVGKPLFRNPYQPLRYLLDLSFNSAYDDSTTAAAQPDSHGTIPINRYRRPYNPFRAIALFGGGTPGDTSVAVVAQVEQRSTVVRNTFREPFDSRQAAISLYARAREDHDDSTVVPDLSGGIYIPLLRRRRR